MTKKRPFQEKSRAKPFHQNCNPVFFALTIIGSFLKGGYLIWTYIADPVVSWLMFGIIYNPSPSIKSSCCFKEWSVAGKKKNIHRSECRLRNIICMDSDSYHMGQCDRKQLEKRGISNVFPYLGFGLSRSVSGLKNLFCLLPSFKVTITSVTVEKAEWVSCCLCGCLSLWSVLHWSVVH